MEQIYTAHFLLSMLGAPIEDGAIWVRSGRIMAVGAREDIRRRAPTVPCTDFGNAIVLPPLVNAHSHLELTHFRRWRGYCGENEASSSFVDWILQVIRIKRSLPLELYQPSLEEGIRLSLAAGTGAIGDILSYFPARAAYARTPLFGRFFLETLGRDPALGRQVLERIVRILDEGAVGRLQPGISPHSPYSLSSSYLEIVLDSARRNGVAAMMHVAESRDEVEFFDRSRGELASRLYPLVGWGSQVPPPARRSPVAYLDDLGALVPWNLLVHGVQVTSSDADRLGRAGCTVVLCPRSNDVLGVGRAPVELLLQAGVSLALGTDSLASCDNLSVWDEIAFARTFFEGRLSDRKLLQMATIDGARALGVEDEMGALEPGRGASFQVLQPPQLPALSQIEEFLCSPGRTMEVKALYLGGREVLQSC